ncbi:MAG: MFS transporter [Hamadaea sp.]|uniref:MFS transporter n=1 Tax=Hamadaea sp. TaxID=2024425 RepID=UPI0017BA3E44|nr:MFS transporter [Hamadaea sp.]NUT17987.1 MFS transporter [Hamadaea sp.]
MSPRWSVATVFAVHGSISGSLAARMPWIADHVGLAGGGVGKLGYALVMPAIGAILTMPFAGRVVHRLGGRRATLLLVSGWALALTLISFMPTLPTLAAAMFVAGTFAGTADMAMNAEGIAVERQLGRSIMSSLHGGWSIGGFLAGGVGWLLAHNDVSGRANFIGATVVAILVALWACSNLPAQTPAEAEEDEGAPKFALPKGPILIIGLVGFAAIFAESASADWSAVYLVNQLGAGDATGAVAYATFAGAMTFGRLTGDGVVRRWGPVPTVRAAGVLGVLGGVLIVVAGAAGGSLATKVAAIAGYALVGIGIAVVVPLAFAAAGHSADSAASRAHAIAGVATVSYGAGLAAPGIVGGIANATSLTVSFVVVTVLILVMTLAAPALRSADVGHVRDHEPESVPA